MKSNPDSYEKIDDYFNGKNSKGNNNNKFGSSNNKGGKGSFGGGNKFGGKGSFGGGKKFGGKGGDSKFKNNKAHKKPVGKRPGKVTRMNNRNKKFSSKKSR